MRDIRKLIQLLRNSPPGDVFNPWHERDPDHDRADDSPRWRRENLIEYFHRRVGKARWLLIAEAVGFRGGKFSGIAMTCERQLAQSDLPHARSSHGEIPLASTDQSLGVLEPTAMIVARTLASAGVDPNEVVLWNTFAWHPHKPGNRLTNRTPTYAEVQHGIPVLQSVRAMFEGARVIAIGKTAQNTLYEQTGIEVPSVRHPANGGAKLFAQGILQNCR